MKIPQNKIDEVASSIDIVEVISAHTPLRKAGRSFMGRCPFHEERSPSFSVSQEKGVYHCFGCGKSGNVFTFVMETEHVTFFEAVKLLADKAGVQLEFENEPYDPDRNKIETYYEINKQAGKYYYDNLMSRHGEYAREYLKQRGLKDEMIKKFGLGYSLREKDALLTVLQNDFSEEDLIASGMIINIAAKELRDRFRGRLMFPVFNEAGKVIAFGGRRMYDEASDEAKYINSPETRIYNKSKTLYGLNFAKSRIKETGFVILVEGYMDLISLFQYGVENVVASSGTSLTNLHVKILFRYTKEVVIVFDSDLAGQNASRRAIEMIIENDMSVSIVALPLGYDPDTYIKNFGTDAFYKQLGGRKTIIDYIAESYKEAGKMDSPEGKTEFVREIIGLIAKMRDEIKRDFYIKDISERFTIYESIIRKELAQNMKLKSKGLTREIADKPTVDKTTDENTSISESFELSLIKLFYFGNEDTKDYIINNLEIKDLKNNAAINVINFLIENFTTKNKINQNHLFMKYPSGDENKIIGSTILDDNYVIKGPQDYTKDVKSLFKQFEFTKSYRRIYLREK